MAMADIELDPAITRWVERIAQHSAELPGLGSPDLPSRRAAAVTLSDRLATEFTAEVPPTVDIDEVELPVGGAALLVRRYRRRGIPSPAPTQLFLHGGGFVIGSVHELVNDRLLAGMADTTGIQLLSLDYALAPEHPYPAARDQVIAALDALLAHPEQYDVDPARLGVGGNSAGAAIVAGAALRWRDLGRPALIHQSLEVPATSLRAVGESAEQYGEGYGLDAHGVVAAYLPDPESADVYLEPLDHPVLAGLPPTLVATAEFDPLRDGGEQYAERLAAAGVPVTLMRGDGELHASFALTAVSDGARRWQARVAAALRAAYRTDEGMPRAD